MNEVDDLLRFLRKFAGRIVGQQTDTRFEGGYCRFGMIIVGRWEVLETYDVEPTVAYMRKTLVRYAETIYVLAPRKNENYVEDIYERFKDQYDARRLGFRGFINLADGKEKYVRSYLLIMRRRGTPMVEASE